MFDHCQEKKKGKRKERRKEEGAFNALARQSPCLQSHWLRDHSWPVRGDSYHLTILSSSDSLGSTSHKRERGEAEKFNPFTRATAGLHLLFKAVTSLCLFASKAIKRCHFQPRGRSHMALAQPLASTKDSQPLF